VQAASNNFRRDVIRACSKKPSQLTPGKKPKNPFDIIFGTSAGVYGRLRYRSRAQSGNGILS